MKRKLKDFELIAGAALADVKEEPLNSPLKKVKIVDDEFASVEVKIEEEESQEETSLELDDYMDDDDSVELEETAELKEEVKPDWLEDDTVPAGWRRRLFPGWGVSQVPHCNCPALYRPLPARRPQPRLPGRPPVPQQDQRAAGAGEARGWAGGRADAGVVAARGLGDQ